VSLLLRLRWRLRSLPVPRRPSKATARHRDLFASQEAYLEWRNRQEAGLRMRYVFTGTRARGTRTPETVTTEDCSSYWRPGGVWVAGRDLTLSRLENSFTEHSSSGDATADHGASGAPLDSAG
jgi:hypothetical protein